MVSQLAPEEALQLQPAPALTPTLPVAVTELNEALVEVRLYEQLELV